jgi:hypothetical protein
VETFLLDIGVASPKFPAIAAVQSGGTQALALVWQFTDNTDPTKFLLAYNLSNDNGVTWTPRNNTPTGPYYRFIPSDNLASAGPANVDKRSSPGGDEFTQNLRPDVTQHFDGTKVVTHVAWHEFTGDRRDIVYSFYDGTQWGSPFFGGPDADPLTVRNMTEVYGAVEPGSNLDKARVKIVFGEPGNRLQAAYVSRTSLAPGGLFFDVFYNGWQLGNAGDATVDFTFQDADCDTLSDAIELTPVPSCSGGVLSSINGYDCDADQIPDFLDRNSDNDLSGDYEEKNAGTRATPTPGGPPTATPNPSVPPTPPCWRDPGASCGAFVLPIILKDAR